MNHSQAPLGETAVVIGASMGGLLAARVLADFFQQVIVIERDGLPSTAVARKGVPQGQHAHALLGRGREILEHFFPGLTKGLLAQGAVQGQGRFHSNGGVFCQAPNAPQGLFVSRPCLELAVRGRVQALPNVQIRDNCDVLGLLTNEDRGRVTGLCCRQRAEGAGEEQVMADLVVDASGRGSRTPAWLEAMGYAKPEVELVEVGMGYTTRFYRREPDHFNGDVMVNISPTPDNQRACGMMAQEGDRWIVTLAGYFGDHPPTDEAGYLAFARSLAIPDVYNIIHKTTPLTEPVTYKFPSNQRRHYEKMRRFPEGLLVFGDAICSFTPIYGQGMTVAAIEATVLHDCLSRGAANLAARFFQQASKVIDIPWNITVGNDLRLTPNPQFSLPVRFINWYVGKLQIAARHDPELSLAFMKVANLFVPPPSLLHPRLAWRVLIGNLRFARQRQPVTIHPDVQTTPSEQAY